MSATEIASSKLFLRPPTEARVLSLLGVSITVLAGLGDSDQFTLLEYSAEMGAPGPVPHWHKESTEWFYVTHGQFTFEIEGQQKPADAGTFVLVPPRTVHRFWNSAQGTSRFTIGFNRPAMDGYFDELFEFVRSQTVWPPRDMARLEEIAERFDTFSPARL
jgi:mannose-6-phosphate isomerase-like protein (cupin superfamily)